MIRRSARQNRLLDVGRLSRVLRFRRQRSRACNYTVTAIQTPVAIESDRRATPATKQAHIQVEAREPAVSRRLVPTSSYGEIWQQHIAGLPCFIVDIVLSPDALATLRERKVPRAISELLGGRI